MASLCVIARHEAIQWVTETPNRSSGWLRRTSSQRRKAVERPYSTTNFRVTKLPPSICKV